MNTIFSSIVQFFLLLLILLPLYFIIFHYIQGKILLRHLRSNTWDVGQILNEMFSIAKENFDMYNEYIENKAYAKESILNGLTVFMRQSKLLAALNRNLRAKWRPMYKFLKENKSQFEKYEDLNNAFNECKKINRGMWKYALWYINFINAKEYVTTGAKIAFMSTAILAVGSTVMIGAAQSMVNNAGKDIGNSPKSAARFHDSEGNLFDEDYNRVPY